jgi:hypothetical protein
MKLSVNSLSGFRIHWQSGSLLFTGVTPLHCFFETQDCPEATHGGSEAEEDDPLLPPPFYDTSEKRRHANRTNQGANQQNQF